MLFRVFPRKTKFTPTDERCFFGPPPMFFDAAPDAVHVSCVFSWDLAHARFLADQWRARFGPIVKIGGPALKTTPGEFEPGRYIREGVTFTSRGCPNRCPWCLVPKIEGDLRLLAIKPGRIVNDNNFLACPRGHREQVYSMLREVGGADFRGGLEAKLLTQWDADQICSLKNLSAVYLACDRPSRLPALKRALDLLAPLRRPQKVVYTLIGFEDDSPDAAWDRILDVVRAGAWPYPQLYRPLSGVVPARGRAWHRVQDTWCNRTTAGAAIRCLEAGDIAGLDEIRHRDVRTGRGGNQVSML